jgi:hypothetical protein
MRVLYCTKSKKGDMMAEENKQTKTNRVSSPAEASEVQKAKFDWRSLNTLSVVSIASALTGIGALMAIITGHISLAQIKRSGENGRLLAILGTVLGYVNILTGIIFITLSVLRFAFVDYDMNGLQPGMSEFFEFRRGFGDRDGH